MPDELRFREQSRRWTFIIAMGHPRTQVHDTIRAANAWCEENLDPGDWEYSDREIHIYDETAAAAFKLRWC